MSFNGEGNGKPLQYSCLENLMDGGVWQAAVHEVAKSRIRLRNFTLFLSFFCLNWHFGATGSAREAMLTLTEAPRLTASWRPLPKLLKLYILSMCTFYLTFLLKIPNLGFPPEFIYWLDVVIKCWFWSQRTLVLITFCSKPLMFSSLIYGTISY